MSDFSYMYTDHQELSDGEQRMIVGGAVVGLFGGLGKVPHS
ncbi:hypothetical protein [Ligilactobacillus apodemi]|nr:hypothetical protein [Ligilactobacillus apodemi]MCR1900469.1 hypothetical protein [Ligilactobacillus apodemi]